MENSAPKIKSSFYFKIGGWVFAGSILVPIALIILGNFFDALKFETQTLSRIAMIVPVLSIVPIVMGIVCSRQEKKQFEAEHGPAPVPQVNLLLIAGAFISAVSLLATMVFHNPTVSWNAMILLFLGVAMMFAGAMIGPKNK